MTYQTVPTYTEPLGSNNALSYHLKFRNGADTEDISALSTGRFDGGIGDVVVIGGDITTTSAGDVTPDPATIPDQVYAHGKTYVCLNLVDEDAMINGDIPSAYLVTEDDEGTGQEVGPYDYTDKKMPFFKVAQHTNLALCGRQQYPYAYNVGGGRGVFFVGWAQQNPDSASMDPWEGSISQGPSTQTMGAVLYGDKGDQRLKWAIPGGRTREASAPMGTLELDVANVDGNGDIIVTNSQDYKKIRLYGTHPGGANRRLILTLPSNASEEYNVVIQNGTTDDVDVAVDDTYTLSYVSAICGNTRKHIDVATTGTAFIY